jgi:hypothetical protein
LQAFERFVSTQARVAGGANSGPGFGGAAAAYQRSGSAHASNRRARSTSSNTTHSHATPARARTTRPDRAVDFDAARLQALLGDHDGLTTTAIADHTGANRIRILAVLRRLETDGQIRRTGVRRSTRWHTITDEDPHRPTSRPTGSPKHSRRRHHNTPRPTRRSTQLTGVERPTLRDARSRSPIDGV